MSNLTIKCEVCRALLEERADLVITDPYAMENASYDLGDLAKRVKFEADPYEAAKGAHAVAILTEWSQFAQLDYAKIYSSMVKPAFIFDGRNLFDPMRMKEVGFEYHCVGRPSAVNSPAAAE